MAELQPQSFLGPNGERLFVPVRIAVLTVSDTRSLADDKSGNTLVERLTQAGHLLAARDVVRDEVDAIRKQVLAWVDDSGIDVVLSTGGPGVDRKGGV